MERAVFIIPGYQQLPTAKAYRQIAQVFLKQGFSPTAIKIPWNEKTISQNSDDFLREFEKKKTVEKYLFGFSYGAMMALVAAAKIKVFGLILCSLSPYFREDLLKKENPQLEEFINLRAKTLARKIKAKKVLLLYGKREDNSLKKRVIDVFGDLGTSQKYIFPIEKTEHEISAQAYLRKISQAIKVLN